MLKITKRRGRKGKGLPAEHRLIDIVFLVLYGAKAGSAYSTSPKGPLTLHVRGPCLPITEGDFARRPGTVEGYRRVKGKLVKVKPDCSVKKACEIAEQSFALKTPRPVQSTRLEADGSFTESELELRPLIAKRRSDAAMPDGTATRQSLHRALLKELESYKKRGFDWEKADWNWKKALLAERQKKKR
jgi:hypothetical protein